MNLSDSTGKHFLQSVIDAMPHPVLVVNNDIRIHAYNQKAGHQFKDDQISDRKCGDILKCLNAITTKEGCGGSEECKTCDIRNSVNKVAEKGGMSQTRVQITSHDANGIPFTSNLLVTAAPIEFDEEELILLTIEDINDLMALRNFLPICSQCKNIRDEDNYWVRLEKYFKDHLNLDFSHGICPDCMEILYAEIKNE